MTWKKINTTVDNFKNDDGSLTLSCSDCSNNRSIRDLSELINNPICLECGSNNIYLKEPTKA